MSSQPPIDPVEPHAESADAPSAAASPPQSAGDAAGQSAESQVAVGAAAGEADDFEAAMKAAMAAESAAATAPAGFATPDGIMGTELSQEELDAVLSASGIDVSYPSLHDAAPGASAAPAAETAFVPPSLEDARAAAPSDAENDSIAIIQDVTLDVSVELGRTSMLVEDVLRLGPGAVVELDKLAGDPVEIYVNERLVARGEVLVLNDDFCVRVSEIVTPVDEPAEEGQPA